MREIEFRAKHTWDGSFVYGYLGYKANDGKYIINNGKELNYFIDPETIGQYTGLKDKNGTKIFEGDILTNNCCNRECDYHIQGYVSFRNGSYVVIKYEEDNGYRIDTEWEVIGNIYDNPELLEG